jgi:hypothetical protein
MYGSFRMYRLYTRELCSPHRWKAVVETNTAKEWVYTVIAAEAITIIPCKRSYPHALDSYQL